METHSTEEALPDRAAVWTIVWVGGKPPRDALRARGVETLRVASGADLGPVLALAPDLVVLAETGVARCADVLERLRSRGGAVPIAVVDPSASSPDPLGRYGVVARWPVLAADAIAQQIEALLRERGAVPHAASLTGRWAQLGPWAAYLADRGKAGFLVRKDGGAALSTASGRCSPDLRSLVGESAMELRFHEVPPDRVRIASGEGGSASLEGARVLVIGASDEERRSWCSALEEAGATTLAVGDDDESRERARAMIPSVVVVAASSAAAMALRPWDEDRLIGASFVAAGEDASAASIVAAVSAAYDAERDVRATVEAGRLVLGRLETFGPARWLKVVGACDGELTFAVRTPEGSVELELAAKRVRGARFSPAGQGEVVQGKKALAALLAARVGRVRLGTAEAVEAHRDRLDEGQELPSPISARVDSPQTATPSTSSPASEVEAERTVSEVEAGSRAEEPPRDPSVEARDRLDEGQEPPSPSSVRVDSPETVTPSTSSPTSEVEAERTVSEVDASSRAEEPPRDPSVDASGGVEDSARSVAVEAPRPDNVPRPAERPVVPGPASMTGSVAKRIVPLPHASAPVQPSAPRPTVQRVVVPPPSSARAREDTRSAARSAKAAAAGVEVALDEEASARADAASADGTNGGVKIDATRIDPAPELVGAGATQAVATKADAAKGGAAKNIQAKKQGAAKPTNAVRADAKRRDVAKVESAEGESAKVENAKVENAKVENAKVENATGESAKLESAGTETASTERASADGAMSTEKASADAASADVATSADAACAAAASTASADSESTDAASTAASADAASTDTESTDTAKPDAASTRAAKAAIADGGEVEAGIDAENVAAGTVEPERVDEARVDTATKHAMESNAVAARAAPSAVAAPRERSASGTPNERKKPPPPPSKRAAPSADSPRVDDPRDAAKPPPAPEVSAAKRKPAPPRAPESVAIEKPEAPAVSVEASAARGEAVAPQSAPKKERETPATSVEARIARSEPEPPEMSTAKRQSPPAAAPTTSPEALASYRHSAGDDTEPGRDRKITILMVALLVLVGGGIATAVSMSSAPSSRAPTATPPPAPTIEPPAVIDEPEPPPDPEPPPLSVEEVDALVRRSEEAYRQRSFTEAETLAREALAASPQHERATYRLALALFRQRRSDEALVLAERLVAMDADEGLYRLLIGDIHTRHGRFVQARRTFEACAEAQPTFQPCHDRLARWQTGR